MSYPGAILAVFQGGTELGQVDVYPVPDFTFPGEKIEINRLSPPGDRVPPLSVLLTLSPLSMRCKIDAGLLSDQSRLADLHSTLLNSRRTAIMNTKTEDLHLIAMPSREKKRISFWCWSVPPRLYDPRLKSLQRKILPIVLDLDQTLLTATNTKDLASNIESLEPAISTDEHDSTSKEEMDRLIGDYDMLCHYIERDQVFSDEKLLKAIPEEALTIAKVKILVPVIRIPEKNIVFTRVNPERRDSSFLVRLRDGWDDLKAFLVAKDHKRFDVYVCTKASRDYALEMWRILDSDLSLIRPDQLHDRISCVGSVGFLYYASRLEMNIFLLLGSILIYIHLQ